MEKQIKNGHATPLFRSEIQAATLVHSDEMFWDSSSSPLSSQPPAALSALEAERSSGDAQHCCYQDIQNPGVIVLAAEKQEKGSGQHIRGLVLQIPSGGRC